jgi:membrane protein DedA with SNARE-associated domain
MIYYIIIAMFVGLFVGYNLGRRQGITLTLHQVPLYFLEKSLERGYCIICGQNQKDLVKIKQDFDTDCRSKL